MLHGLPFNHPSPGHRLRHPLRARHISPDYRGRDGWQKELSDKWRHYGNPWDIKKPDISYEIGLGGHTESYKDEKGRLRMRWLPARMVNAVAYDTPIPGYRVNNVNLLRLWSAEAVDSLDFEEFNDVRDRLKVFCIPNYNVKVGHTVYPMADLSEQISLAGKEASGTGNMKFSMNGALTIGTLDGANVEIREEVGPENFFLFGLNVDEVKLKSSGYNPRDYYQKDKELQAALDLISSGHFSGGDRELFRPLVDSLLFRDEYMLLADYRSYVDCQDEVGAIFKDREHWTRMSILNAARMGKFSSDRSINQYCQDIWHARPHPVKLRWKRIPEEGIVFRKTQG